jgi:hypothetical protein
LCAATVKARLDGEKIGSVEQFIEQHRLDAVRLSRPLAVSDRGLFQ